MENNQGQQNQKRKIQTALLNTVAGDAAGEYFVLANWHDEPIDPDEVICCVVAVGSTPAGLMARTAHSLHTWGSAFTRLSPSTLFIGNADGDFFQVRNGTVQKFTTGLPGGIEAIAGNSETDCWFAHGAGISHWDGKAATTHRFDVGTLYSIHFARPDFAVAVGNGGFVIQFDGARWHEVVSSPCNSMLTEVYCVSTREIYICGWNGTLYRWDGNAGWTKIDVIDNGQAVTAHLYSVIEYQGQIYVSAGEMGLFKIDGKVANRAKDVYSFRSAVANGKLLLTGSTSFVEFDGLKWNQLLINLP